jgi:DNA-binding HxlR family transcriptional regulator
MKSKEIIPSKEDCASSLKNILDTMYVLNGKWKLAIILCLVQGPKRFNEIQKAVSGISPKILANELKDLEQNYFIIRTVYDTTPVSILYEATEYSLTLKEVLSALNDWGAKHRKKVMGK